MLLLQCCWVQARGQLAHSSAGMRHRNSASIRVVWGCVGLQGSVVVLVRGYCVSVAELWEWLLTVSQGQSCSNGDALRIRAELFTLGRARCPFISDTARSV